LKIRAIKKAASVSEGRLAFSNLILRMRGRGRWMMPASALSESFKVFLLSQQPDFVPLLRKAVQ